MQSLLWKEGAEKWEALSRINELKSVYENHAAAPIVATPKEKVEDSRESLSKIITTSESKKVLPKFESLSTESESDEEPPPIPLDALLNPAGDKELFKPTPTGFKKYLSKMVFFVTVLFFIGVLAWFVHNEKSSAVQIKIQGVMPIYVDKLQEIASGKLTGVSFGMALSIDKTKLYATSNQSGDILTSIKLVSVPKRILGSADVQVQVRGMMKNHLAVFDRMTMIKGPQLIPGEYEINFTGKKIHYLNSQFKFLSDIDFFKGLNTNYSFKTIALIYPGTPRDFELKINEYKQTILSEILKPHTEKLEQHQTFLSLLNKIMESYLLVLDKISKPKDINAFEKILIKEVSPVIQSLVIDANEKVTQLVATEQAEVIANYKNQVQLGKQIGELASDMITITQKSPKFALQDKTALKQKFETRYKFIKSQIDGVITETQNKIESLSK